MKIFRALKSGIARALKAWKGILIVWLCYLLLVLLIAIPAKNALNSGFGHSMLAEKLSNGFSPDVFGDLGQLLKPVISWFSSGLIMIIMLSIIMNSFLSGGLFYSLKGTSVKFSSAEFFRASARYFWSILVITLIINIMLPILALFIVGLPVSLAMQSNSGLGPVPFIINVIALAVVFLVLMTLLLVADYARSWQVATEEPACFRALGFGFDRTFRTYLSSFPMMLIVFTMQILFIWFVVEILEPWKPQKGGGVFLLFLLSQFLFFTRLLLKTWRYASVTSLKEIDDVNQYNKLP